MAEFTFVPPGQKPCRATSGSAGYDLFSPVNINIPPHQQVIINTFVKIKLPAGQYAKLESRSSMTRQRIYVTGVIDSDYNKEIHVILHNNGENNYTIQKNERIAQLIIMSYFVCRDEEPIVNTREGGFGSTGK